MSAFSRNERAKRAHLNTLAVAYATTCRQCVNRDARNLGDALREAVAYLWNAGGPRNVAASIRAAQLAILAVGQNKPSIGSNVRLGVARFWANLAIGYELGDNEQRSADISPLAELAEIFWQRGDAKHGRASVAVLGVIECLLTAEVQQ